MKQSDIIQQLRKMRKTTPSHDWKMNCEKKLVLLMHGFVPEKRISFWSAIMRVALGSARTFVIQPTVLLLLVLGTAFGSSLLVNAAFYSLPGDHLYSLKIRLERAQLALMSDKKQITELKVELTQKRVQEIDKIMLQPEGTQEKEKKMYIAVKTFKQNIEAVKEDVEKNIPEKEMNLKIAITLNSTSKGLEKTLENQAELGEDMKRSVENAKDLAEEAGITALIGSISQYKATSTEASSEETIKNSKDINDLVEQKLQEVKDAYSELEKKYAESQDKRIIDSLNDTKKILEGAEASFIQGNFDEVLKNIQMMKKMFRGLEGLDDVSSEDSGLDVKAVTTDN